MIPGNELDLSFRRFEERFKVRPLKLLQDARKEAGGLLENEQIEGIPVDVIYAERDVLLVSAFIRGTCDLRQTGRYLDMAYANTPAEAKRIIEAYEFGAQVRKENIHMVSPSGTA